MKRFLAAAFASAFLAFAPQVQAQTPPNVLVVGQIAEPKSLDPHAVTAVNDFRILVNLYDGLVRYKDGTLEVEPSLAESWTISEDGKTYTFKLREGVTFHNGDAFTADDVIYTYNRAIDPDKSIQIGIRTHAPETCGLEILYGEEIELLGINGVVELIEDRVGDAKAYMTFDIDCLDPAFAPGTGTPVSGGLSSREAMMILRRLGEIDFVGGDVVEVAPAYDHADITSIAGASVALTYIGLLAEKRR